MKKNTAHKTDIRALLADFCATRYNQVAYRNELIDRYRAHMKNGGQPAYVIDPSDGHGKAIRIAGLHARGVHTYYVSNAGDCLLTSVFDQHTLGAK